MNEELKCIICGAVLGIFLSTEINPICGKCLEYAMATPHIIEYQSFIGSTRIDSGRLMEVSGTAGVTSTSYSSSGQSSISSSTTILPSELV